MPSTTIDIGTGGKLRITVTLLLQDYTKKTSKVRVQGEVWTTSGSVTDNTGNCKTRFTGTNSTDNKSIKGTYNTTPKVILTSDFTVSHASDGTKTVTYSFHFGPTNSTVLGKTSSIVTQVLKLPSITNRPGMPSALTAAISYPLTITVGYSAPNTISPITEYQIEYAKNIEFSNSQIVSAGTALSKALTGLDINCTYYMRVRAANANGWGDWSEEIVSQSVPNVPDKMVAPDAIFTPRATVTLTLTPPVSDGGSPITSYDVQYAKTSDFAQVLTKNLTDLSIAINDLAPTTYYFRVRAKNLLGDGEWSDAQSALIISGPKIKVNGVYYPTFVYVRYDGIYRTAIPYVKQSGVWEVAGG